MIRVPEFEGARKHSADADCSSRHGAERMADNIEKAWKRLGHKVKCEVYPIWYSEQEKLFFSVKSDLVNGLPREVVREIRR